MLFREHDVGAVDFDNRYGTQLDRNTPLKEDP